MIKSLSFNWKMNNHMYVEEFNQASDRDCDQSEWLGHDLIHCSCAQSDTALLEIYSCINIIRGVWCLHRLNMSLSLSWVNGQTASDLKNNYAQELDTDQPLRHPHRSQKNFPLSFQSNIGQLSHQKVFEIIIGWVQLTVESQFWMIEPRYIVQSLTNVNCICTASFEFTFTLFVQYLLV